jgi:hypothetical protein
LPRDERLVPRDAPPFVGVFFLIDGLEDIVEKKGLPGFTADDCGSTRFTVKPES